jgi:tryptophan-rich sensory protein
MDGPCNVTITASCQVNRLAALLLVPYFVWISYASWLNALIWHLNRLEQRCPLD